MSFNIPTAEMTWKLPVSLVHTLGVFEMLVSVILVSKHFATPLTLVTLAI